jgi:hypothetical protein
MLRAPGCGRSAARPFQTRDKQRFGVMIARKMWQEELSENPGRERNTPTAFIFAGSRPADGLTRRRNASMGSSAKLTSIERTKIQIDGLEDRFMTSATIIALTAMRWLTVSRRQANLIRPVPGGKCVHHREKPLPVLLFGGR